MLKLSKRKIFRILWLSGGLLFLIWNWSSFQARGLPEDTFQNTPQVTVIESKDKITFQTFSGTQNIEVIFFQGGLADPHAYAPLCRKLAEGGFTTHLIKMACRLPNRDYEKVLRIFDLKTGHFVIGGHSQGGKIAAQLVHHHPGHFKGLFLLGTSHPRDFDMSSSPIPAMKIYGTLDGLASPEEVLENKDRLPFLCELVPLEGGNHSQFGYLGNLFMDNAAVLPLEDQQLQTSRHLLEFLSSLHMYQGDSAQK